MPTMRKRKTTQELSATPVLKTGDDHAETPKMSLYEQSREDRIKENKERLQKLGIVDLSEKLRSSIPPKRTPRRNSANRPSVEKPTQLLLLPGPVRRSSRLQNVTPVSYSDEPSKGNDLKSRSRLIVLEEGVNPEIYTEEHEKLLGNTERSWELFVDGYGKDGKRIYDQVIGKTCHQCRQKTLGHRTRCCKCNMVQGQFCGDCLYMRYGEHVLEARDNPNWMCPACRGICNCSLCRQAKGWPATGMLYKKVTNLGYKSVAHYLIQTKRAQNNVEEETPDVSSVGRSVKRSLPFSDPETLNKEVVVEIDGGDREPEKLEKPAKRSLPFSSKEDEAEEEEEEENNGGLIIELEPKIAADDGIIEAAVPEEDKECVENESSPTQKTRGKPRGAELTPDSIGSRLRQRRRLQMAAVQMLV